MDYTRERPSLGTSHPPVLAYASAAVPESRWAGVGTQVGGLVLRGAAGVRHLERLRRHGYGGAALLDPQCYSSDSATPPSLGTVGDSWLKMFGAADSTAVIAPGRLVPAGAGKALDVELRAGTAFLARAHDGRPGYVGMGLDSAWLKRHAELLVDLVGEHDAPVALVLRDSNDPLSTAAAVAGLLHLLHSGARVLLLRADLGAIGAVANGADGGAVGLSSTTRHLSVPMRAGGSRNRDDRSPSVLLPGCHLWVRASRLGMASGPPAALGCPCRVCRGWSLARFADPLNRVEAHLHSVEVWNEAADRIRATSSWERPGEWSRMCAEAVGRVEELEYETGLVLVRGGQTRSWLSLDG